MSFFGDLFGGAAEKEAADRNRGELKSYRSDSLGYLDKGLGSSTGYLDKAVGAYGPLADMASQYRGGTNLYLDSLGINGADGNARASGAFTTSPGYQQGIDAGIDVLNRRRAAGGMVNSGNADLDALKYGQNMQNQQWSGWQDRLSGINQNALAATGTAAAGQAGGYGALSDLYNQDAQSRVGIGGTVLSGNMNANNQEAQGRANGAKNLMSAGMGLASLAMGGGGFGFGGLGAGAMGGSMGTMGGPSTYSMGYGGQNMPVFGRPF